MAETLGELIVSIGTEASRLNAGLKDAEAKVQATAGKISQVTNKIALGMTAAGAAITGAFALMIKATTDYGEEIYRTSERTGVAVETLSRLKYVADQTESSFEAVAMGFKFLNKNIYEATTTNDEMRKTFAVLGVTLRDEVTGNVMKADEAFLKIADRFSQMQESSAKTDLAMKIFGRSGEGLIPILNLGSDGIARLSQEAERLGLVLTADNAKAIDEFSDSMNSFKGSLGGLALDIFRIVKPAIENFIKFLTNVVVKIREWSEAHSQLSKRIVEFTLALGVLMIILGPLLLLFNQLAQAIIFLNVLFPKLTLSVGALQVALGSLKVLTLATIATFAGWKLGEWLDNNTPKIEKFWNKVNAFLHPYKKGSAMEFDVGSNLSKEFPHSKKEEAPAAPEVDLGGITAKKPAESLDETVNLVERHAQKLKELNEEYIAGKITAMQYYEAVKTLHSDGIDATISLQQALESFANAEDLLIDKEKQKALVIEESARAVENYARIKAELADQEQVDYQNTLASATNLLKTIQSMHTTLWQGIFDFINMGIQKFSTGFSTALTSIIMGTKKASEAFKDFGKMMIEAIVEFLVQWAVQAALSVALGWLLVKFVTAQANAIAEAWMPAAIAASVATLGAADAVGALALAGAMAGGMGMLKTIQKAGEVASPVLTTFPTLTPYGEGGIVTNPTLALIGERGPEMIIPLDKMHNSGDIINISISDVHLSNDLDIEDLAEKLGENINTKRKRP